MNSLLLLSALGVLLLLLSLTRFKTSTFVVALVGLIGLIGLNVYDWLIACQCESNNQLAYINDMVRFDNFSYAFFLSLTVFTLLTVLILGKRTNTDLPLAETLALLLFSLFGGYLMVSASNMAILFLGVETLSIPLYILVAANKHNLFSNEAALKYFILGAFASGFLLFGMALVYGATGSFNYSVIQEAAATASTSLLYPGLLLILVGLSFKVAIAPFHFWSPDVYQGSPTSMTAYMATVVKTAAVAALFRLFSTSFLPVESTWIKLIAVLAALTIAFGNIAALRQKDIKRLLAYSSIAHAGYLTLALVLPNARSASALFIYTTAYSFGSIILFTSISAVERSEGTLLSAWSGLWKRNSFITLGVVIGLFSLAGLPPFAGFFGKFYLFSTVLNPKTILLIGWAILFSLIGIAYYLKVASQLALGNVQNYQPIVLTTSEKWALSLATLATVALGIYPNLLLKLL